MLLLKPVREIIVATDGTYQQRGGWWWSGVVALKKGTVTIHSLYMGKSQHCLTMKLHLITVTASRSKKRKEPIKNWKQEKGRGIFCGSWPNKSQNGTNSRFWSCALLARKQRTYTVATQDEEICWRMSLGRAFLIKLDNICILPRCYYKKIAILSLQTVWNRCFYLSFYFTTHFLKTRFCTWCISVSQISQKLLNRF